MADRIVLLGRDDESEAIIEEFAERTGLRAEPIDGGARFWLGEQDHGTEVVQTLTEIDPGWTEHVALGDPGAEPSGG